MAFYYDDDDTYNPKSKWTWTNKRIWNPLSFCSKSGKWLFLKKAYVGERRLLHFDKIIIDTNLLCSEQYVILALRGELK